MEKIIVTTQSELDAIPVDFNGEIEIVGIINKIDSYYPNAIINVYGSAQIRNVYGSAQIRNVSLNIINKIFTKCKSYSPLTARCLFWS